MKKIIGAVIFIGVWLVHAPFGILLKRKKCPLCRWADRVEQGRDCRRCMRIGEATVE